MFNTYKHPTLSAADETLNHILDLIVEGTWDWNSQTGHVDRSPGWYRMLGYEVGVFQKNVFTWENIIHPEDYERVMSHFELFIGGGIDEYCVEYRCKKSDGRYLWILDRGKGVSFKSDGSVCRMIGAHHNIHEHKMVENELMEQNKLLQQGNVSLENRLKKKAEELEKKNQILLEKMAQIEFMSNTDPLTGVANRKYFEELLLKEVHRANRYQHPLSLAIFDIDLFKGVNDLHGHKAGDTILQDVAELVSHNIRDVDLFARWGGDEFVIIFPDLSLAQSVKAIDKLRDLISEQPHELGLTITCSFGITQYAKGDSVDELFHRADERLYRAKEQGRNRLEY